jgi:microcystin-dependent protein
MADAYLGEIRVFAGNYAPVGWLLCDGSTLQVSQYQALYALIGNTYGGTASSTFALPDLRGRLIVGQGSGTNLTPRVIGQTGGTETVALTQAQMPAHTHSFTVSTVTNPASINTPSNGTYLGSINSSVPGTPVGYVSASSSGVTVSALNNATVSSIGNSASHNNLMPFIAINYIICINGLYPTPQ